MSARRRSQLVGVACALALALAVVSWTVTSAPSAAPRAASVADDGEKSSKSAEHGADSRAQDEAMLGGREAVRAELVAQTPSAQLGPTERVLRGRVACEDISGFEIRVAVFAFDGREPALAPLDETFTDGDGPYVLSVQQPGDFALLAFAPGHRPATSRFSIAAQTEIELPPLRLETGASISGVVHNAWTDGVRETMVRVRARESGANDKMVVHEAIGGRFVWSDGAFDWAEIESNPTPDSTFWLPGLRPASYSLSVLGVGALGLEFPDIERVSAPAEDVLLTVSACTLNLHVFADGRPARSLPFTFRSIDGHGGASDRLLATDADGNVSMMLAPYSRAEIRRGAVVRPITAAGGGEELELSIAL